MLRPVMKKTASHNAWQNSNTAGSHSKPSPAAISGGSFRPLGKRRTMAAA